MIFYYLLLTCSVLHCLFVACRIQCSGNFGFSTIAFLILSRLLEVSVKKQKFENNCLKSNERNEHLNLNSFWRKSQMSQILAWLSLAIEFI